MIKKILILTGILILVVSCAPLTIKSAPTVSADMVQLWAKQTVEAIVNNSTTQGIPILPQPSPTANKPVLLIPTQPPAAAPTLPPRIPTIGYVQPPAQKPCDQMTFVADVTVPDDTVIAPGQSFQKVWRIQNTGTCTWTTNYQLVFVNGHQLGAQSAVGLPRNVMPNETIDLAVNMVAPNTGGAYQGYWRMRNASGVVFGTTTNNAIWVKIRVGGSGSQPQPPSGSGVCTILSMFPGPNDRFAPGQDTDFSVTVRNDSNVTWSASNFDMAYIEGSNLMKRHEEVARDMPVDVVPGGVFTFALDIVMPSSPGVYTMDWGIVQGHEVYCQIRFTGIVN